MNRKLTIIIGLQAFLIIVLFWVLVFYGKDEFEAMTQQTEEEIETPNRVVTEQGMTVINISAATQALATEAQTGYPKTREALETLRSHSIESVGERVRKRLEEEKR